MIGQFAAKTIEDHLAVVRIVGPWSCWKTPNHPKEDGYVRLWMSYEQPYAHRAVYEYLIGSIHRGKQLDHLCRNRWCCNPNHVEPVTGKVNTLRGDGITAANARKTACLRGHQFTIENTYIYASGSRACRTCLRQHAARYQQRKKEKP